jgi:hypothetical protein
MAASKIDLPSIRKKIYGAKVTKKQVFEKISKKVEENKSVFISEFSNHPVTTEISGGPNASNISGTLGGKGNLFSFIGFDKNKGNPALPVISLIKTIRLLKKIDTGKSGFIAKVRVPAMNDFASVTRMPWESGRSWLLDIEKRISGLGSYLYGKFETSRSGTGIQTKNILASGSFRPVKYFREIYQKFIKNIKNESRIFK